MKPARLLVDDMDIEMRFRLLRYTTGPKQTYDRVCDLGLVLLALIEQLTCLLHTFSSS